MSRVWRLKLDLDPWNRTQGGKQVEYRLNKPKWNEMAVGDTIEYLLQPDLVEIVKVEVMELLRYPDFESLLWHCEQCGYIESHRTRAQQVQRLNARYSANDRKEFGGVLGIRQKVLPELPRLYHMVVGGEELRDRTLYALNELEKKHPDLYELHVAKYANRQHILQQRIPYLNCLWNSVVFLTPVHPDLLCFTLAQSVRKSFPSFAYYEIPVADLDQSQLVIWPFRAPKFDHNEVTLFNLNRLEQFKKVPEHAKAYFRGEEEHQRRPLFFVHVPHVLHQGAIDVSSYPLLHTEPREPKH